jgi:hypothetical protein
MNDDELLELLRRTVAPSADSPPQGHSPPPAGFAALHLALTKQGLASRPGRLLRRRWVIPALTTVMVLGSAAGALAATGLPGPLRDLARMVRLPVSDPHRPSMSELVTRLRIDRARRDSRAADRDARTLATLLGRGAGNATDRAEARKALDEEEVPRPGSLPPATTTGPTEGQSPETETTVIPSPNGAGGQAPEPDSTVTQPSSSKPSTTETSEPTTTTTIEPPQAQTSEQGL